jgi:hypothetical protein
LTKLGSDEALRRPEELAGPLVFIESNHNSKGFHQVDDVRHMISEVIRESDELEDCLLNRGLGKVKDLQALLWSE